MATGDDKRDRPTTSSNPVNEDDASADENARRSRLEGFIPDLVKRTFYAGLGAIFTTEEGIRKIANDFQLPKDVANFLISQAASSKDELFRIVGREIRDALQHINLAGELQKLLTALSFEIKTEVRFIPNDQSVTGVKSDVRNKVAIKRVSRDPSSEVRDVREAPRSERGEGEGGPEGKGEPGAG